MKKYIARPGEKVTIEINRQTAQKPKNKIQSPKGLLSRRRESDYQARRLPKGGITFYDLGLTFSESGYVDIESQVLKDWTNTGGDGLPFAPPLDDADFAERDARVLANFPSAAQIKPAYTTIISLNLDFDDQSVILSTPGAGWSNSGFAPTNGQINASRIAFSSGNPDFFDSFVIQGDDANKITSVYDYAAAPVTGFRLQKQDKIYLVPVLCRSYAIETFSDHLGFFNFVQQLNAFWLFFPRAPLLAGLTPFDIDGKDLENARVMRSTQNTFGVPFINTAQPPEAFESSSVNSIVHELPADTTRTGFLVAVIRRGESLFYVWKS